MLPPILPLNLIELGYTSWSLNPLPRFLLAGCIRTGARQQLHMPSFVR